MAYEKKKNDHNLPVQAATTINPKIFLKFGGTSTLLGIPLATLTERPHYYGGLGTTASGLILPADEPGQVVKALCCASVGAGQEVGLGSTNGALGASGLISASGHWAVGISLSPADAGEIFSVDFRPRKV